MYGQITEILATSKTNAGLAFAVLDVFDLKASRHPLFGMPVLARPLGQASYTIVPVEVGLCTRVSDMLKTNTQTECSVLVQHTA